MGMCKPSGGVKKVYGPYGRNIKEATGETPNSRTDYHDEKTGELLQQRWYDSDGLAIWDRDWNHGNKHKHTFPHDHPWDWTKEVPRQPSVDYINKNYY